VKNPCNNKAIGCSACRRRCRHEPGAIRLAPTKSDAFDAFVLADSLRHEHRHWRSVAVPSPLLAELRALTRDRERLIWNQRDVENQLRAIVLAYHPGVLNLFSSLDRDIALAFLRDYPTPIQPAGSVLREWRRSAPAWLFRPDPTGTAGRAVADQPAVSLRRNHRRKDVCRSVVRRANSSCSTPKSGRSSSGSRTVAEHPDAAIFLSFPGMGEVTRSHHARRDGEDRGRFPTADVLLAETGTAPVTRSSGRSRTVRFRTRQQADAPRHRLVGVRRRARERLGHDAYQQARDRGQLHNRALRGVGARWTRILWRCWIDHTTYDPARQLKSHPAAITA